MEACDVPFLGVFGGAEGAEPGVHDPRYHLEDLTATARDQIGHGDDQVAQLVISTAADRWAQRGRRGRYSFVVSY